MSDSVIAPEDSVLRRHFESALRFSTQSSSPNPAVAGHSTEAPEDSVLRRHYECAQAMADAPVTPMPKPAAQGTPVPSGMAAGKVKAPPLGGRDPLSTQNTSGPSALRPAHIDITQKRSGGLLAMLKRLLGGG